MNFKELKQLQKYNKLNQNLTLPETVLRKAMFEAKIHYQKQKIMGKCIIDFYLPKRGLLIEIDGDSHLQTKEKDYRRDRFFESWGYITLRFTNEDVKYSLFNCISKILEYPETSLRYRKSKQTRRALQKYTRERITKIL